MRNLLKWVGSTAFITFILGSLIGSLAMTWVTIPKNPTLHPVAQERIESEIQQRILIYSYATVGVVCSIAPFVPLPRSTKCVGWGAVSGATIVFVLYLPIAPLLARNPISKFPRHHQIVRDIGIPAAALIGGIAGFLYSRRRMSDDSTSAIDTIDPVKRSPHRKES